MSTPKETRPFWFWIVAGIAAILVGVSFWSGTSGEFVYDDDKQVVANALIQNPNMYGKALTSDVWAFKSSSLQKTSNYWRPTFTLLSIINFQVFELQPFGWHVVNIVLHGIATYLGLLVLFRLGFSPAVCAGAAWIFAAHPAHVESVTWIAGSPDLLMAIFMFGALLVLQKAASKTTPLQFFLIALFSFLAMGSKEVALSLIPISIAFDWARGADELSSPSWKRAIRSSIPILIGAGIYVVLKAVLVGASVGAQSPVSNLGILVSIPGAFLFYLKQAFLPTEFSSAYPFRTIPPKYIDAGNVWIPLIATLAIVGLMIWMARKSPRRVLALTIFLAPLLPAFYFRAFHFEHAVRDRYLYLPILGLGLLLFEFVASKWPKKDGEFEPKPLFGIALAISIALAVLCQPYNAIWMNDETFWRRGIETDPMSYTAHVNLSDALIQSKKYSQAEAVALKAVQLNPISEQAHTVLGLAYLKLGRNLEAVVSLEKAIAAVPQASVPYAHLAQAHLNMGEFESAIGVFERQMKSSPGDAPVALMNMAVSLVQAGRSSEALRRLDENKAVYTGTISPEAYPIWFYYAELANQSGRSADAKAAYQRYLQLAGASPDAKLSQFAQTARMRLRGL